MRLYEYTSWGCILVVFVTKKNGDVFNYLKIVK
jgi:hypothetical protein